MSFIDFGNYLLQHPETLRFGTTEVLDTLKGICRFALVSLTSPAPDYSSLITRQASEFLTNNPDSSLSLSSILSAGKSAFEDDVRKGCVNPQGCSGCGGNIGALTNTLVNRF